MLELESYSLSMHFFAKADSIDGARDCSYADYYYKAISVALQAKLEYIMPDLSLDLNPGTSSIVTLNLFP